MVITGVLYPHYIGNSLPLVYDIVGGFIAPGGLLASVHIENWYEARFPLARTHVLRYPYRDYVHLLELYRR